MESFDCSIIIPTFNTKELTLACLRDLKQNPPRIRHEITVVDNNSSDGTLEAVRTQFPDTRIIANPANLGFGKACNLGAQTSLGRYICFLNSDTVNATSGIEILVKWLNDHPKTGIAGPELLDPNGKIIQMSWVWNPILWGELLQQYLAPYALKQSRLRQRCVEWLQRKSRHVSIICGACLVIRSELFREIQGFDEDFELYFEDSDLCYRGGQAGWDIDFVSESKITHYLGQSTKGKWSVTSLIYQQSHIHYYRKHSSVMAVWLLKGYLLFKWMRILYKAWIRSEQREVSIPYCRAYGQMILEKRKVTLVEGIPR